MAIAVEDLKPVTVGELLSQDLRIPLYQRPYRWRLETAQSLLDDIWGAWRQDRNSQYALGSVILYTSPTGERHVVDGQQRLLSLQLLVRRLRGERSGLDDLTIDEQTPQIVRVHHHMRAWVATAIPDTDRADLLDFVQTNCALVQVVTNDEDEAFRFFDSQNYRGKPLKPHDLLKAHHLRALGEVRPVVRTTIVQEWESVDDFELEHLFSRYLYRIAQWSRGRPASREFGIEDLALFKGINAGPGSSNSTPAQKYHLAVQRSDAAALGAAAFVPSVRKLLDPAALRARFQLDAPIIAGSDFFARVSFLMEEQRAIQKLLDEQSSRSQFTRGSRYRYVTELFLAAVLYWTNKYFHGDLAESDPETDPELKPAWDRLYIWAYGLRLERLRVTWQSVNLYATRTALGDGAEGLFATLHEGLAGTELNRLLISLPPIPEDRDKDLSLLLRMIEGNEA
ncbi:DUF262 domain-containing protein [Glutamicibacter sp. NPDC087344]|uniref:DUF262 domain-containing protein n=1 Tax=Glutamicibacter sp. NPDC087344 TaxID=3363994 RepID=UPI00380A1432